MSTSRARNTDPATSHVAAAQSYNFDESHKQRIVAAIRTVTAQGKVGATAAEIADASGLTVVQIDRRLPELEREGHTFVIQYQDSNFERDGYRVWEVVEKKETEDLSEAGIRRAMMRETAKAYARALFEKAFADDNP